MIGFENDITSLLASVIVKEVTAIEIRSYLSMLINVIN